MKVWCEKMIRMLKSISSRIIDFILYSLLSERQKERLANLFSDQQKERIRRITGFGKRNAQIKLIDQISKHLYSKGFTIRAYEELRSLLLKYDKDPFMKRLIHFELALWHANQMTEEDAKKSLHHLAQAKEDEKNKDQLRRISILEAENYCLLKDYGQARAILEKRLSEDKHPDLYFGIANTIDNLEERLSWINKAFSHYNLTKISFETLNEQTTYNELQTKPITRRIQKGPKVSVILPAYNAEDGLHVAIESILNQTWQNLELIIVDDCSTDDTLSVIKQYAEKDKRIKWDQTPENSGPYVARNIGLTHATGEFVTVNDADDWSHAEKLEKQVKHLIDNPDVIANTSEHARLTEDLTLYRRGTPGRYIFPNMSSIMFRRKPVVESLGFWDSVRFAADGEFKRRLLKQFGNKKYVDLETGPLSLPRQSVSSLTGSSAFGYNGFFMGARKEYVESLEFYHDQAHSLYYPYPLEKRLFPIPNPMHPKKREISYDLIVATDFRILTEDQIRELKDLLDTCDKVGLIQLYKYDLKVTKGILKEVRTLIDGEKLSPIVYGESVKTKKIFILNHHTLKDEQRYIPTVSAEEAHIFITEEPTVETIQKAAEQLEAHVDAKQYWHAMVPVEDKIIKEQTVHISNKPLGSLRNYV